MINLERLTYILPVYNPITRAGQVSSYQGLEFVFTLKSERFATSLRTNHFSSGGRPRDRMQEIYNGCVLVFETTNPSFPGWEEAVPDYRRVFPTLPVYIFWGSKDIAAGLFLRLYEYGSEQVWEGLEEQHEKTFGEWKFLERSSGNETRYKRNIQV